MNPTPMALVLTCLSSAALLAPAQPAAATDVALSYSVLLAD